MSRYFITGTDTGVGKTFVACALARAAVAAGRRVFAFKPIETGCTARDGRWFGEDGEALAEAAGGWQQGDLRGLYRFELPAAPSVAATTAIDLDRIREAVDRGSAGADLVLVEGAGGWRVPISREHDMSSLAKLLDLQVIVVARATLGTINHSVLTIEAVRRDHAKLAGLILSRRPDESLKAAASNLREIQAQVGGEPGALAGVSWEFSLGFT